MTTTRSSDPFFADLAELVRAVEFRNVEAGLTCVVGFGSEAWDKLFGFRVLILTSEASVALLPSQKPA